MAKTTAAATAAAASADTPIARARLLSRPRLSPPAPETEDGGPGRVRPGGPAPRGRRGVRPGGAGTGRAGPGRAGREEQRAVRPDGPAGRPGTARARPGLLPG